MFIFIGNSGIIFPLMSPSNLYASLAKFDKNTGRQNCYRATSIEPFIRTLDY